MQPNTQVPEKKERERAQSSLLFPLFSWDRQHTRLTGAHRTITFQKGGGRRTGGGRWRKEGGCSSSFLIFGLRGINAEAGFRKGREKRKLCSFFFFFPHPVTVFFLPPSLGGIWSAESHAILKLTPTAKEGPAVKCGQGRGKRKMGQLLAPLVV